MTQRIESGIVIDASPARVWEIVSDFDVYPEWNPFIRRIVGQMRVGAKLEADLRPPGGRGMTMRPTVLAAEPEREFHWIGSLGIPGIFDGEHGFRIEPIRPDRVRFVQEERFSGVLAPLILRFIRESTLEGFAAMNRALKDRAEGTMLSHA